MATIHDLSLARKAEEERLRLIEEEKLAEMIRIEGAGG